MTTPKVNPLVPGALKKLGYGQIEIKYGRVYARRGVDHIIVRLAKNGNPDFRSHAHQDRLTGTLPTHHHADFTSEKELLREFYRKLREMEERGAEE